MKGRKEKRMTLRYNRMGGGPFPETGNTAEGPSWSGEITRLILGYVELRVPLGHPSRAIGWVFAYIGYMSGAYKQPLG